jgi:uncharacterized membrane protein
MNQPKLLPRLILACLALIWCLALLLPPAVASLEQPPKPVSGEIYHFFSPICHQADARSLHLFGYKLAVCGRCFGAYAGFFAGILLWPLVGRERRVLRGRARWVLWAIAVLPMLADVALGLAGVHERTLATRVATGSFFGLIAALVLAPLLEQAIEQLFARTTTEGVSYESKA